MLQDLLQRARSAGAFVVHVQNDGTPGDPDEPGTEGWQLVFDPAPDEVVVTKDDSDVFVSNPGLTGSLREQGVDRLVVAGMQSEFCIRASSHGALREGFTVIVPAGAHATYDGPQAASVISAGIESELRDAGVEVVDLADVTF